MTKQSSLLLQGTLTGLHWKPHRGQVRTGIELFYSDTRSFFIQCGRKWGKTDLILYCLWRWAQSYPNSSCYYISPFFKQSKEIIWANRRAQNFGPREWITSFNNSELRINFKNGSFIKLDGSDNHEAYRGVEPHILIMEEYKDHKPEFMEAMRPNLSVYNAPCFFIGTPPEEDDHFFWQEAEEHISNDKKFYYQAPTSENPYIDKQWLEEEKKRLYDRNEGDSYEREYEAKKVKGGASKIFPMLNSAMVLNHDDLIRIIYRDKRKLDWYLCADPAAATCFGVLFAAVNPYTREWFVLDEIYEKSQEDMTVKRIGKKMFKMRDDLFYYRNKQWNQIYDEAETWFNNEIISEFGENLHPTHKAKSDKISGLSQIKDIMLGGKLYISDRAKNFYWELDHYRKDKNGKIPKKNDHLIDCFRYILDASYYDLQEKKEYVEAKDDDFRGARINDDFPEFQDDGSYSISEYEQVE